MNVAVIGTGNIGRELARALPGANHTVTLANSRGPESLEDLAEELGARAATVADAVAAAEVVVLSIPFGAIPGLGQILRDAPASTVIVEMSNYYPEVAVIEGVTEAASSTTWLSE